MTGSQAGAGGPWWGAFVGAFALLATLSLAWTLPLLGCWLLESLASLLAAHRRGLARVRAANRRSTT